VACLSVTFRPAGWGRGGRAHWRAPAVQSAEIRRRVPPSDCHWHTEDQADHPLKISVTSMKRTTSGASVGRLSAFGSQCLRADAQHPAKLLPVSISPRRAGGGLWRLTQRLCGSLRRPFRKGPYPAPLTHELARDFGQHPLGSDLQHQILKRHTGYSRVRSVRTSSSDKLCRFASLSFSICGQRIALRKLCVSGRGVRVS
jgi:hypothetical protein